MSHIVISIAINDRQCRIAIQIERKNSLELLEVLDYQLDKNKPMIYLKGFVAFVTKGLNRAAKKAQGGRVYVEFSHKNQPQSSLLGFFLKKLDDLVSDQYISQLEGEWYQEIQSLLAKRIDNKKRLEDKLTTRQRESMYELLVEINNVCNGINKRIESDDERLREDEHFKQNYCSPSDLISDYVYEHLNDDKVQSLDELTQLIKTSITRMEQQLARLTRYQEYLKDFSKTQSKKDF